MQKETIISTEIDQFLEMVKKTFSDVLLPVEAISMQKFLGKGKYLIFLTDLQKPNIYYTLYSCCNYFYS